jgi:dolichol-phosphate mannosyltransferase
MPGMSPEVIDVVVPAHNEGASIGSTLRDFHRTVAVDGGISIRFIVCEDGSTDDTVEVLKKVSEEIPLKLISDPVRKGYSRAVIDGMRATDSEWVASIDSDGQCDPSDFARLVGLRSGADLIIGWRNPRSDTWVRKVMSSAFGVVYRLLFNVRVRDPSCPYLLVHRPALQKIFAGNIGILKQGFWHLVGLLQLKRELASSEVTSTSQSG